MFLSTYWDYWDFCRLGIHRKPLLLLYSPSQMAADLEGKLGKESESSFLI